VRVIEDNGMEVSALEAPPEKEVIDEFRVVAICHSGLYGQFHFEIARLLKERYGSEIHYYCVRPEVAAGVEADAPKGLITSINVIDFAQPTSFNNDFDVDTLLARAKNYEERYGRSIYWFAVNDRHFGRGFAPAGFLFPKSRASENTSYHQVIETYCGYFDFWEREFEKKGITLLVNGFWREAAVAHALGVPIRRPTSIRYKNYHYWTTDEFAGSSHMAASFANASVDGVNIELDVGPYVQEKLRQTMRDYDSYSGMIKGIARKLKNYGYYKYKGHTKSKHYYLYSDLLYYFRRLRAAKIMTGRKVVKLSEIANKKFVYFPLQVDPEAGFQGHSPEFFFQHTAIIALARDLPSDYLLVIKEHFPALGLRSRQFYQQIDEFKNVAILDIREVGVDVVRQCQAVATITGSSGLEAAILGKPVISFGRRNIYDVMPHVHVVKDLGCLHDVLRIVLDDNFDDVTAAREGRRFIEAALNISFDLQELSFANGGGFDSTALDAAFDRLCDSLKDDSPASPSIALTSEGLAS